MITREADYGIRLVLCLADHFETHEVISTAVVAKRMDIPYRYLRVLSRKLIASGLVLSKRGKYGGMRLARPPAEVSLLDVVRVLDPRGATLNRCLTDSDVCSRDGMCRVHDALAELQSQFDSALNGVRFDQFLDQSEDSA